MRNTLDFEQCTRCKQNLTLQKGKYEWFVKRGYSQKDAAAEALYNPAKVLPPKSCCITQLHTGVDSYKKVDMRTELKIKIQRQKDAGVIMERLKQHEMLDRVMKIIGDQIKLTTDPQKREEKAIHFLIKNFADDLIPQREIVKIYATDSTGKIGGEFIIFDADFTDLNVLTKPFSSNKDTFKITNITKIPQRIADSFKWLSLPVCLWSENIKIIPVVKIDGVYKPGRLAKMDIPKYLIPPEAPSIKFRIIDGDSQLVEITERFDESLLNAEIIYYTQEKQQLIKTDSPIPEEIPVDVITLRKQYETKTIATKVLNQF